MPISPVRRNRANSSALAGGVFMLAVISPAPTLVESLLVSRKDQIALLAAPPIVPAGSLAQDFPLISRSMNSPERLVSQ